MRCVNAAHIHRQRLPDGTAVATATTAKDRPRRGKPFTLSVQGPDLRTASFKLQHGPSTKLS